VSDAVITFPSAVLARYLSSNVFSPNAAVVRHRGIFPNARHRADGQEIATPPTGPVAPRLAASQNGIVRAKPPRSTQSTTLKLSDIFKPSLAALLTLPASLAIAQETREITGALQYRERIALPEDAQMVIELRGWQDAMLGMTEGLTAGRQVPLPFAVDLPAGLSARLRAGILTEGRLRWISDPIEIAAGNDPLDLGQVALAGVDPLLFASTFQCGDQDVRIGIQDERAVMELGDQRYPLIEAIAASGAKYEAEGDPSTYFWSKGDQAMISIKGQDLPDCTLVPPVSPRYTAAGNEPGWSLSISDGQITLLTDYGQQSRSAPLPPIRVRDGAYLLTLAEPTLEIAVRESLCHDSATGMPYPDSLTLTGGAQTLTGCGGDPLSLLGGTDWTVETIAGTETADVPRPTLAFGASDRVTGSSGCNRYTAAFNLTGEGISIGQAASTMMACAPEVMSRERAFLDALAAVARFDVDPAAGTLRLIGADDQVLISAQR